MENFANFLFLFNQETRKLIRNIENIEKKLINCQLAVVFNETCLNEDILPIYTNITTHDPAARNERFTIEYRKQLIKRQISLKYQELDKIKLELTTKYNELVTTTTEDDYEMIKSTLQNQYDQHENSEKCNIIKKLNSLSRRNILLPDKNECFINLSDHNLTESEKEVLNLGINCHIQKRFDPIDKKVEMEMLYTSLLKLQEDNKIRINRNLKEELRAESTRQRSKDGSKLLSKEMKETIKNLKENDDIIIRKADKSNIFVILNKSEYINKINHILNDDSKFCKVNRDTTAKMKADVNKLIEISNYVNTSQEHKLNKIIGEYEPGYIYGNVKIHKPSNPLRPIISQIPTPTYQLAKSLNKLITQYIPNEYSLKSTDEFIDILKNNNCEGILASLDDESLFTNVPVEETIKIISDCVYKNQNLPPLNIPQNILEELLRFCTTKALFRCPEGKLYNQINGIAMGSPLGPTFANFYMGSIENKILENLETKPKIYCRYVDDIFIVVRNEDEILSLKHKMEEDSVLKFTYEIGIGNKIPFLDVDVSTDGSKFVTKVHRKSTDKGWCLNYKSECPNRYKVSVIRTYIRRAFKICSSEILFHQEVNKIKKVLVNNGYSNLAFDEELLKFKRQMNRQTDKRDKIPIYFKNQMTPSYKVDERILKTILSRNTECTSTDTSLDLIVYYKNMKTSNLIMQNNPHAQSKLKSSNVIYRFSCPHEDCPLRPREYYVGYTQTTLSRRLTMHLGNGAIKDHFQQTHDMTLTRNTIVDY